MAQNAVQMQAVVFRSLKRTRELFYSEQSQPVPIDEQAYLFPYFFISGFRVEFNVRGVDDISIRFNSQRFNIWTTADKNTSVS